MKLIAGLGNPGPEYALSRHNVGFLVLDLLFGSAGCAPRKKFSGEMGRGVLEGEDVVLLKPLTYMNVSGESVGPAAHFFGIEPKDVIVVHDDIDLPWAQLRIKSGGGHGGHNGVRSAAQCLGSPDFIRVKVGVGRPMGGNVTSHVLGAFSAQERAELGDVVASAASAVRAVVKDGPLTAMNKFNPKRAAEKADKAGEAGRMG